ncbi:MAG: hypothetical protein E7666_09105, partial [Ruminococcaceae bacterium]|nr:hypothetical protein [Oscillospiraceae bacterium]
MTHEPHPSDERSQADCLDPQKEDGILAAPNTPSEQPAEECNIEALEPDNTPTPPEEEKKEGFVSTLFDILEMFAWSVFVVMILFTFVIRLCRVEGQSMENTLYEGENLLLYSLGYTPKQNDVIVFHLTET